MIPPPHPAKFKGTPDEWMFWKELYERELLRPTGWLYCGDGSDEYDPDRDLATDMCLACGRFRECAAEYEWGGREYPDPCLGLLPGVVQACCGHGRNGCFVIGFEPAEAFDLQTQELRKELVASTFALTGPAAARKMRELGGNPPPRAFSLPPIPAAREAG